MRRRIDVPGCHNFRDLGGYPAGDGAQVRWRTLFRADALHELTPEGVARFVGELGIGAIVDLRSSGELAADGRGPLADAPPRYHHLPLFDGPLTDDPAAALSLGLADRYLLMAEHAKGPMGRVIETLAEARAPAVYHCAAGKDRTGVVSAILLGLLGVRDEIIAADYAATQETLDAIVDRLMSNQGYREVLETLPPDTLHAEPETVLALLDGLRERYGSLEGYARKIGLGDETLQRLRRRLLEPAA